MYNIILFVLNQVQNVEVPKNRKVFMMPTSLFVNPYLFTRV